MGRGQGGNHRDKRRRTVITSKHNQWHKNGTVVRPRVYNIAMNEPGVARGIRPTREHQRALVLNLDKLYRSQLFVSESLLGKSICDNSKNSNPSASSLDDKDEYMWHWGLRLMSKKAKS